MKIKYLFFLLLTGSLLFSASCKKEDAEIRTMIVGAWQTKIGSIPPEYHLMEFTADGRFRQITHSNPDTRADDLFRDMGVTFEDSVFYRIDDGVIIRTVVPTQKEYIKTHEVCWIRRNWMKIKDFNSTTDRYKRR